MTLKLAISRSRPSVRYGANLLALISALTYEIPLPHIHRLALASMRQFYSRFSGKRQLASCLLNPEGE